MFGCRLFDKLPPGDLLRFSVDDCQRNHTHVSMCGVRERLALGYVGSTVYFRLAARAGCVLEEIGKVRNGGFVDFRIASFDEIELFAAAFFRVRERFSIINPGPGGERGGLFKLFYGSFMPGSRREICSKFRCGEVEFESLIHSAIHAL